MVKRRRTFIFKLLIGIPILWFAFIGFTVVISSIKVPESYDPNVNPDFVADPGQQGRYKRQPVLEKPNSDRLEVERNIQKEAQERFRKNERLIHERKIQIENHNNDQFLRTESPGGYKVLKPGANLHFEPRHQKSTVDPKAPGEGGKAIIIQKEKLSPEQRKLFDDGFQKNAFNQYASDMMSLHRNLPDVRDAECIPKVNTYRANLPDTSVIICFHNEAWSVLLRTVHSVLDRSPAHLIKEIILVDDFSDFPHLKQPLEDYIAPLKKVRTVRAKRREGLIRARLLGASVAQGGVLTYLDSHCECAEGWLEPLLDRIAENKTNVVCPVIDVIDDETFRYQYGSAKATSIGGFDWNLQFNWHAIPQHEKDRRGDDLAPVRSPTMAGGLFSISREYFEYLGAYDPGMDIWGGENLELSFRVWMCGGTLEIVPCSHVGHIFRKRSPYSWKTGINVVKKNSVRLAEVWMDEYKSYYYERFNFDLGPYGDISARKSLRQRLKCKSFDWFIKNIYPDLFIPGEATAAGEIRSKVHSMCLDSSVDSAAMNKPIKMWQCHNQGGNQFWMMSKGGEIRRDEGCMDYAGQFVMVYPCHSMKGNQEWSYGLDQTLRHMATNLCVEISEDGQNTSMKPCSGIDRQIWLWKRKTPASDKKKNASPMR